MGNENIRPEKLWRKHFEKAGFRMEEDSLQYIRFLPSCCYNDNNLQKNVEKEQRLWKKNAFLRHHAFWGINMVFGRET